MGCLTRRQRQYALRRLGALSVASPKRRLLPSYSYCEHHPTGFKNSKTLKMLYKMNIYNIAEVKGIF